MKNIKNFIIPLLMIVIAMAIGYSTFVTQIKPKGTAEIVGEWDVKIINIEAQSISEGCSAGNPQYTDTNATFDAQLVKPGDTITYVITIQNAGTIDAVLDNIIFKEQDDGSPEINFETGYINPLLESGNQTKFELKIIYNPKATEVPSIKTKTIKGIIEYVQNR